MHSPAMASFNALITEMLGDIFFSSSVTLQVIALLCLSEKAVDIYIPNTSSTMFHSL